MKTELIAPCGMNCALCGGYLALRHDLKNKGIRMPYCEGCRQRDKKCAFIKKRCGLLPDKKINFCFECKDFPCERLKTLDKRYRERYRMSMIENLEFIKKEGVEKFIDREYKKWRCNECGETICCHNGICFNCGQDKLKIKKKLYLWEDE